MLQAMLIHDVIKEEHLQLAVYHLVKIQPSYDYFDVYNLNSLFKGQ